MQEIDELNLRILWCGASIAMMPVVFYASYLSRSHFGAASQGDNMGVIYGLIWLAFTLFFGKKLQRLLKERHAYRLGLDCEMAVGQELNNLMGVGYRVYHDVPADGSNIDHVVIGRNGVFAVETKGRSKPHRGDVTVVYDGRTLKFSDWIDTIRRQAQWLSQRLSRDSREAIPVKPVLVIAGWRIEKNRNKKKRRNDVLVFNGNEACQFIATEWTHTTLSNERIQHISDELEQVCRDVEPMAHEASQKKGEDSPQARKVFGRVMPMRPVDGTSAH